MSTSLYYNGQVYVMDDSSADLTRLLIQRVVEGGGSEWISVNSTLPGGVQGSVQILITAGVPMTFIADSAKTSTEALNLEAAKRWLSDEEILNWATLASGNK
ncbi:hypothetical protein [Arthrobacter sp. B1805]|uniref:hypothetical protein n=1 Tax=Arthrobacter sp. B1805 TaxID=2058892 RepID=UPI000CE41C8C|nr:hypothetical protein [Arthrobacter sp. B1805]